MQNGSLLFAIVTYKEKYYECSSFVSLLASFQNSGIAAWRLSLFIVDNTDVPGWRVGEYRHASTVQINYIHLQNPGLPTAYNLANTYALENGFDWIVLLDQDTKLPENFFETYIRIANENEKQFPIKAPVILDGSVIMSPSRFLNFRSHLIQPPLPAYLPTNEFSCINSGLMIHSRFFEEIGGYNPALKLDFCDHDFIEKAMTKTSSIEVIKGIHLQQDFSASTHSKAQALTRYKLYCKDLMVFYRQRNKVKVFFYVDLPHLLKLTLKYKSFQFLHIRVNQGL